MHKAQIKHKDTTLKTQTMEGLCFVFSDVLALSGFWFLCFVSFLKNFLQVPSFKFQVPSFKGFTLLEMVISIGVFSALVIISTGIILGVSNVQVKAQNTQSVLDNIRFSLELITKEMRTGSGYALTATCIAPEELGSEITFTTSTGEARVYFLDAENKRIMRAVTNIDSGDCVYQESNPGEVSPFTSEEIWVDRFKIILNGATPGLEDGQPRAAISIKITSRDPRPQYRSTMDLQTTVVQRLRDL